jgi:hypothetical protein
MARAFAILLVLGCLAAFLSVHTQGVDRAFGGALARFTKRAAPKAAAYQEPNRRPAQDWWEREERPPQQGIGQRVRERVNTRWRRPEGTQWRAMLASAYC